MDKKAMAIVEKYILEHLDVTDGAQTFSVFTVWKAKILQNWKYLISSTLPDGMYYELTTTAMITCGTWMLIKSLRTG